MFRSRLVLLPYSVPDMARFAMFVSHVKFAPNSDAYQLLKSVKFAKLESFWKNHVCASVFVSSVLSGSRALVVSTPVRPAPLP